VKTQEEILFLAATLLREVGKVGNDEADEVAFALQRMAETKQRERIRRDTRRLIKTRMPFA
jgi:uncharacterized ferredoxin-like protein